MIGGLYACLRRQRTRSDPLRHGERWILRKIIAIYGAVAMLQRIGCGLLVLYSRSRASGYGPGRISCLSGGASRAASNTTSVGLSTAVSSLDVRTIDDRCMCFFNMFSEVMFQTKGLSTAKNQLDAGLQPDLLTSQNSGRNDF
jgi:hypothetical protein